MTQTKADLHAHRVYILLTDQAQALAAEALEILSAEILNKLAHDTADNQDSAQFYAEQAARLNEQWERQLKEIERLCEALKTHPGRPHQTPTRLHYTDQLVKTLRETRQRTAPPRSLTRRK